MNALALAPNQEAIWFITLGLATVVVLVVIILLSLLTGIVRDIDRDVDEVWSTAQRVARNTTTTWQLGNTAELTGQLRGEVGEHASLFRSKGGSR